MKHGDTIELYVRKGGAGAIYVKAQDGKIEVIDSDYYDTIRHIKWIIQGRTGHPVERQRIIFAGKELEDNKKTQDYGIQKNLLYTWL